MRSRLIEYMHTKHTHFPRDVVRCNFYFLFWSNMADSRQTVGNNQTNWRRRVYIVYFRRSKMSTWLVCVRCSLFLSVISTLFCVYLPQNQQLAASLFVAVPSIRLNLDSIQHQTRSPACWLFCSKLSCIAWKFVDSFGWLQRKRLPRARDGCNQSMSIMLPILVTQVVAY